MCDYKPIFLSQKLLQDLRGSNSDRGEMVMRRSRRGVIGCKGVCQMIPAFMRRPIILLNRPSFNMGAYPVHRALREVTSNGADEIIRRFFPEVCG